MNQYFSLFLIAFLLILTFILFSRKKLSENFTLQTSYNNNNPIKIKKRSKKKNKIGSSNDTYPQCTPDQLSKGGCNQCPPPSSGQVTYCCLNGNPPACTPPGGQPIPGCTNQCTISNTPQPIPEECNSEQIYQDKCNQCPDKYYCCPSSDPTQSPGCSETPLSTCTTSQCKYHKPSFRNKRTFTFKNSCQEPVCVGYIGDSAISGGQFNGGFQLTAGQTSQKDFPGDWISGRIWPRTGCDSNCSNCQTGDCGGMECQRSGDNPASLFEISMDKNQGFDTYDGSLVDGYNIPISVTPLSGTKVGGNPKYDCTSNSCPSSKLSLNNCPPELIKKVNGNPVGCYSLCHAIDDPNNAPILDQRCKTGAISGCPNGISDLQAIKDLVCCSCGEPKDGCPTDQLPKDPKTGTPINGCAVQGDQKESVDLIKKCCRRGCSPYSPPGKSMPQDEEPVCSTTNWPKPVGFCNDKKIATSDCNYPNIFKKQCPDFYSWQFDDLSSTYSCLNSDFEVEFCPASNKLKKNTTQK